MTIKSFRGNPDGLRKILLIRVSMMARRTFVLVFAIAACSIPLDAQGQVLNEYEAKAGFLYNFVKFVEWPSQSFADASSPLIIGVVGDDRSSGVIDQMINGKTANGRRLVVKRFSSVKTLTYCHMIFVRSSAGERIRQALTAVAPGALTVGEAEGFARWGGIINFRIVDGKLRLEINQTSAERAGLKISAKLLSLATIVRD